MHIDDLTSARWECVHFVHQAPDVGTLPGRGFEVAEIDGSAIGSKSELIDALAGALRFPEYSGANWDAVDECLRDLGSWLKAEGYVFVIRRAGALWKAVPEPAGTLLQIWLGAAKRWAEDGTPFHLVYEW